VWDGEDHAAPQLSVRIQKIMNYRLQVIFLILIIILTACGRITAAEPDAQYQDLLDRLYKYYKSERNDNWEQTYSFRTPLYQKSVPFKLYKERMIHENEGWKLIDYKIIKSKIEGDYAAFQIEFIEQVPDGYFPNNIREKIKLNQISTWEKIHGNWFCRDACDRTHLSMNGDLVMQNDQTQIDLIKKNDKF
jgi:hypothetical protein